MGVARTRKRIAVQCGPFLTCPTRWIARGGGEDLRGKVFKGHDLSVVLDDGFQVQRSLLITGWLLLRDI